MCDCIKMTEEPKDDGFRRAMVTMFTFEEPMYFDEDCIRYAIWSKEKCPTSGKDHMQVYLESKRVMRFKQWKRIVGFSAHIEEARKHRDACIKYCSKEESHVAGPWEQGERDLNTGGRPQTRSDAIRVILERIAEVGEIPYMKEDPVSYALFRKDIRAILNVKRTVAAMERMEERYEIVKWKPWQERIIECIDAQLKEENARSIIWVWEELGNVGKSFLAGFLKLNYQAALCAGKAHDIKHAYNGERVCVIDIPRSQLEFMGQLYTVSEELKNGRFFSGKYESEEKLFEPPCVIFFANAPPDYDKWSRDRVCEFNLCVHGLHG